MKKALLISLLVALLLAVAATVAAGALSNADALGRFLSPNPHAPNVSSGVTIESVSPAARAVYDSSSDGSNLDSQTFRDHVECHHHTDPVSSDSSASY